MALTVAACGSEDSGSDTEAASGFIFFDANGAHVCGSMLESHPPQCGEPSMKLLDLSPESVVALISLGDPTLAPTSWTDYSAGVEGVPEDDGLSSVVLTDPVYESGNESLSLRTVDLDLVVGEPGVWPFDLTNGTDADTMLTFTSGQRMELTLSDDTGEVYRWSDDMMFTQAIEEIALPAGATLPYVLTAEPTDLPPGDYTAKAWVTAAQATNVVLTWDVTISS
jgi:hypothetical protein